MAINLYVYIGSNHKTIGDCTYKYRFTKGAPTFHKLEVVKGVLCHLKFGCGTREYGIH
jgi:hypothetical protein